MDYSSFFERNVFIFMFCLLPITGDGFKSGAVSSSLSY